MPIDNSQHGCRLHFQVREYTFTLDQRCPESAKSHIGKPPVQQFKMDCPDGIYDLAPIPDHNGAWDPMNTTLFRHYLGNDAFAIIDRRALPEIFEAEGKAAATSGGFIYTDDGIILIESFLNEFMACQARALILECYPDVPIKFVLLTSHHGDHAFGTYYWQAPEVSFFLCYDLPDEPLCRRSLISCIRIRKSSWPTRQA